MVYTQEQLDAMKQEFISICKANIQREGLDKLLEWLEQSDFYTAPASANYHNSFPGGLLEHSLNVYKAAIHYRDTMMTQLALPQKMTTPGPLDNERIAICALFHDICKVHFYKPTVKWFKDERNSWHSYNSYEIDDAFPLGHGEKSVIVIQQFMLLRPDEICAIRFHMGMSEGGLFLNPYVKSALQKAMNDIPLVGLIIQADFFASFMMEREFNQKQDNIIS